MSARPKFTIDDVKRLIPEATEVKPDGERFYVIIDGLGYHSFEHTVQLLLTTRRQLEIAREELNTIATQDDIELALDPTWAKRIAEHALDAIKKDGES